MSVGPRLSDLAASSVATPSTRTLARARLVALLLHLLFIALNPRCSSATATTAATSARATAATAATATAGATAALGRTRTSLSSQHDLASLDFLDAPTTPGLAEPALELHTVDKCTTSELVARNLPATATVKHMPSSAIAAAIIELVYKRTRPHNNLLRAGKSPGLTATATTTGPKPFAIGAATLKSVDKPAGTDSPVVDIASTSTETVDWTPASATMRLRVLGRSLGFLDVALLGSKTALGDDFAEIGVRLLTLDHGTPSTADIGSNSLTVAQLLRLESTDLVQRTASGESRDGRTEVPVPSNHSADRCAEKCPGTLRSNGLDLAGLSPGILDLPHLELPHRLARGTSELPAEELVGA